MTTLGITTISEFHPHHAVLSVSGPVDAQASRSFESLVSLLVDDYHYVDITVEIESTGGAVVSLRQMLRTIRRAKERGVTVSTRTHSCAASAAAVLLSFGSQGKRCVDPEAQLVYHLARMSGPAGMPITADLAETAKRRISSLDEWMLNELVTEFAREAGGTSTLFREISQRCQGLLEQYQALTERLCLVQPSSAQQRAERQTLRQLAGLSGIDSSAARSSYLRALNRAFALDRPMSLVMAYGFGLIDRVMHEAPLTQGESVFTAADQRVTCTPRV